MSRITCFDDAERFGFSLMSVGEIPSAVVILMTLGINDEMGEASMAILSGCFGKYFDTGDGKQFDIPNILPYLREN